MSNIKINTNTILGHSNILLLELEGKQQKKQQQARKNLHISLVIDCSGSMSSSLDGGSNLTRNIFNSNLPSLVGSNKETVSEMAQNKLQRVIQAAKASINTMQEDDCVSVISFSDSITKHLDLTPVSSKDKIYEALDSIACAGMTNLYEGWRQGAVSLAEQLDPNKMNRVLLFTDGQTNSGEVNSDVICGKITELAQKNISTSTFGVGLDYNEDLLENMAIAGDGHFYFISDNEAFNDVFEREFSDMSSTVLSNVLLNIDLGKNIEIKSCLNDLKIQNGKYMLPNLLEGQKLKIAFELDSIKTIPKNKQVKLFIEGQNNSNILKFNNIEKLIKDKKNEEYANEIINRIRLAAEKRKAIKALDGGNIQQYKSILNQASANLCVSQNMKDEKDNLDMLVKSVDNNQVYARKANISQSYNTFYGRE